LLADANTSEYLRAEAKTLASWDLMPRQLCDLELLLIGGLAPLAGFMIRVAYESVISNMRLPAGTLWPMPIVLDVPEAFAEKLQLGQRLSLRDPEGVLIAVLDVEDKWIPDRRREAEFVLGTTDTAHPGVERVLDETHPVYLGGRVRGVEYPAHYDFPQLRLTPRELKEKFAKLGWRRIVAYQPTDSMHRAEFELTMRASRLAAANILVHPAAGQAAAGDVEHYTRIRCYEHLMLHYPEHGAMLALAPLATRLAGPREALWHAIVRRNYGATHFVVGRNYGSPRGDNLPLFYEAGAAQQLVLSHQAELGIEILPLDDLVYVRHLGEHVSLGEVPRGHAVAELSTAELRRRLRHGLEVPEWFSFPAILNELRSRYPTRSRQGVTVFFTGLSGAGKSTIARALVAKLMEVGKRSVTLLDGDIVRKNLSSELGFSREHRDVNILRIGFVASEITKHGGIAICAPIAPYRSTRRKVRSMITNCGGFIEVYVSTPIEVCEERDRKGLYAKARAGIIKEFTGVSDPYEPPERAEVVIDTRHWSPMQAAQMILIHLEAEGYVV
jgi:sulfate adenylyltransferase